MSHEFNSVPWCNLLGYPSTLLPRTMASGEKENLCPPHAKRKCLSLKLKSHKSAESSERFPLLSNEQIRDTKQCVVPSNTKKSTDWALRLFETNGALAKKKRSRWPFSRGLS